MQGNIGLFVILMMGLTFDWLFQTDSEAMGKFANPKIRAKHSATYAIMSGLLVFFMFSIPFTRVIGLTMVLFSTHFLIDDRVFVKWWMTKIKEIPSENLKDLWWMNIAIDQIFHIWVIFILAVTF